jgi:hypothetical protein
VVQVRVEPELRVHVVAVTFGIVVTVLVLPSGGGVGLPGRVPPQKSEKTKNLLGDALAGDTRRRNGPVEDCRIAPTARYREPGS